MTSVYRPNDNLPLSEVLQSLAIVTEEDIDEAISQWKKDPPDSDFVGILEAEEINPVP